MTLISGTNEITISGSGETDHGNLTGLGDDDHTQYILTDGSRGFTSTVSGVYPVQDYHLATKEYVDYELSTLSGAITDGFGGQYTFAESAGESQTSSTSYVRKIRLTASGIPDGDYRIGFSWEWRHNKSNTYYNGRVQIDDTDTIYTFSSSPIVDVNTWRVVTNFYQATLSGGTHYVDIDYASSNAANVSYIRNARIEFWRVIEW